MSVVIIATVSISITAFICAALLVMASKVFAVEEAEMFEPIRACLPGANCGACGFAGCDGYARALATGEETRTNLCVPGASGAARAIAEVMGKEADEAADEPAAPSARMALVFCGGDCDRAVSKEDGSKACEFGCVGCGACAEVCPMKAISLVKGIAVVDDDKCVGCGLCANTCPQSIIHLVPRKRQAFNRCSNPNFGKDVMSVCKAGCIGCTKCTRCCPMDAIEMDGKLAKVDPDKCVGCGNCADNCPTKAMTYLG